MIEEPQKITLINGNECSTISIHDRGLNYGDGVFETIAIHDGAPLLWELHWRRFVKACDRLSLNLPDKVILEDELGSLSDRIKNGVIKIILTRGSSERGYKPDIEQENTRILSATLGSQGKKIRNDIEVYICEYVVYPEPQLAGIKHLNRLPQVMASIDRENNDKMGILCDNNNNLVEAISANIFIVANGVLQTPDLTEYGVEGVMREYILEHARMLDIQTKIKKLNQSCLQNAEEVFLTNSIIGILPVRKFINTTYDVGSITKKLMHAIYQEKYYN